MTRPTILILLAACLLGCSQQETPHSSSKPEVDVWVAARTGDIEAIEAHAAAKSNLEEKEPFGGSTPLIVASSYGKVESIEALLAQGVDLHAKNNDGSTALHCAVFFGYPECVKLLLAKGADKTLKNNYGQTPLDLATQPWTQDLEGIYKMFEGVLQTTIDTEAIRATRPEIADLLR